MLVSDAKLSRLKTLTSVNEGMKIFTLEFPIKSLGLVYQFCASCKDTLDTSIFLICGALGDLVAFVQFKKREKHPWRSVNFGKVAG